MLHVQEGAKKFSTNSLFVRHGQLINGVGPTHLHVSYTNRESITEYSTQDNAKDKETA